MRINRLQVSLAVSLGIAVCFAGCTVYQQPKKPGGSPPEVNLPTGHRTIYQEEQTAPGHVPPPPALSSRGQSAVTFETSGAQANAATPPQPTVNMAQGTIQRFAKAYADKGSPRIAVFLNRALSDDVREWQSDVRLAAAYEQRGVVQLTERIHEKEISATQSNVTAAGALAIEQPTDTGERRPPASEAWVWAFEDGFLKPMLDAKVKAVDRATIVRLTAATGKGSALQPVAPKQIEMDALKDHADILVEVLVSRSPSAPYGYEFKASAKEIGTGMILANVTSARWNSRNRAGRVVVATSDGYKVGHGLALPGVQDVASDLALDLMNALARSWAQ